MDSFQTPSSKELVQAIAKFGMTTQQVTDAFKLFSVACSSLRFLDPPIRFRWRNYEKAKQATEQLERRATWKRNKNQIT